jgi:DNA-binding CsgD family transcriptional regulator
MINELSKIESFIGAINAAKTNNDVADATLRCVQNLGFDYATYNLTCLTDQQEQTYFTNYPSEWVQHYIANRYARFDIMANHAATTLLPFSWKGIARTGRVTKEQQRIRNEGAECGLKSGGMIPVHGPGSAKAYFSVFNDMSAEEFEKIFSARRLILQVVANHTHERILDIRSKALPNIRVRLTPREIEIMTWVASGKTNWEVGRVLKISEDVVKDHITRIFEKLKVNNRQHAVAISIFNGYISL